MAYMPHAFQAHVGAAKAGIDMLMKNLAIEWGPHGIRCMLVCDGGQNLVGSALFNIGAAQPLEAQAGG